MANSTLRTPDALIAAGLATAQERAALEAVASRYAIAITPAMAAVITGPDDPVARQFVPAGAELVTLPEERADPIGDHAHSPLPGLVHRYPDRVLMKLTHTCPVYCRFCFRREMVGPAGDGMMGADAFEAALAYIATRPEIFEVILTGGDPLILSVRRISEVTRCIAAIPHVRVIRWHTRVPIVAPERVTPALVKALRATGKAVYVAIHANHVREFTPASDAALARLSDAGIVLISQSVLLKGVNDSVAALADLMRAFLARRVKPYYLHHGDLAPGTSHFRTGIAEGKALVAALRGSLSGLAQPLYVIDTPGGFGKVPVERVEETFEGMAIRDMRGILHPYPPR